MKTSELIEALADTDSRPVEPASPIAPLIAAAAAGAVVAMASLAAWLGIQPLSEATRESWFWMKASYGVAAVVTGFSLTLSLSRPAGRPRLAGVLLMAAAVVAIWLVAIHSAMNAGGAAQRSLWLGRTWMVCPWRIFGLAIPVWLAVAFVIRRLAPTRLAAAGAAAGLFAGGMAVVVYGLYCQESTAPFVAVWYSLGMSACAAVGALLGPRLLRW